VPASIAAEGLGIHFLFDVRRRVVSPRLARLRRPGPSVWGLRGIDLAVAPGEGVALVGASGSGKTTLLRVLARVLVPDEGRVEVRGRVGSLLAVQAGLLGYLTGRENALLLGVLYGLSRGEARAALPRVKERSGIGDSYDLPVSTYSQGMMARLGFAVADEIDPDVLLLDEVHEALDHEFRSIVQERARNLVNTGGVVVATGHDHPLLEQLCSRAIYLHHGSIRADGPFREVQLTYFEDVRAGMHD
jgi:ABC-type polysaccharide/polyol phosphate transport system ATPase subunit